MAEEVRCQVNGYLQGDTPIWNPCNAIIPRLDEGSCVAPSRAHFTRDFCGEAADDPIHKPGFAESHTYLGPLASECEAGHPQSRWR